MVIHSPYTTWDWHNQDSRPNDRADKIERVHETLNGVVKRAEDEGVVIVIENCEYKDPGDRVTLARSFDSPAVRVSLDTGHAHYAHGATGAPAVDNYVRAAGVMLSHVHLQDCDGFADRHWRIGRGTISWHSVFSALAELPEMPRLMLELMESEDILPSAKWLAEAGLTD
jgi:sugar phosphate isomerase/epimerase